MYDLFIWIMLAICITGFGYGMFHHYRFIEAGGRKANVSVLRSADRLDEQSSGMGASPRRKERVVATVVIRFHGLEREPP